MSGRHDCLVCKIVPRVIFLLMQVLGDGAGAKEVASTSWALLVGGSWRGQRDKRIEAFGKVIGQG